MQELITIGGITRDIFILNPLAVSSADDVKAGMKKPVFAFEYGSKVDVETFFGLGGGAANVAVGASRLGCRSAAVGKIGFDREGEDVVRRFREQKVSSTLLVRDSKKHTGFSIIMSSDKGERSALLHRGANNFLHNQDVPWPRLGKTRWLFISHLSGESDRLLPKLAAFLEKNPRIATAWNPGSTQIKSGAGRMRPLLKQTKALILNKEEAEDLTGQLAADFTPAAMLPLFRQLAAWGPELVVITDGRKGARFYWQDQLFFIPALSVGIKVVNTLGAGDAFSSGLVAGLIKYYQKDIRKAWIWAALNGAAVTEKIGAQQGLLNRRELTQRLNKLPANIVRQTPVDKQASAKAPARRYQSPASTKIPVEVSARHLHISATDLAKLFGPRYRLRATKDLSQTGEYASTAQVALKGPKGELKRVRVVGPLRQHTQVETSRSAAIALGLNPPLRLSGDLRQAGNITIKGPKGTIKSRSHIIAKRHLHISPARAKAWQLKNKQTVTIAITGPRETVYSKVVVRTAENFHLACHLDSDEANAAGTRQGGRAHLNY